MDNLNITPNARLLLEGEQMDYTREKWQKMLERLVDPLGNEANSSLTKIKTAFLKLHRDAISKNYYVDGKRGELRSIALDRSLVSWDTLR